MGIVAVEEASMSDDVEIHGFCDERFLHMKEAFADNFRQGLDVGASVASTVDGEFVVDLWGGYADEAKTVPWGRDTIVNAFSIGKIMTAICALMLVDRGDLDLDAPVAEYWPEFGQAGKEKLPVRYIFSHSSGLPGFDEIVPFEALYDWDRIVGMLARQEPWWEPGTASGYQWATHGYLLGELIRRISGKSVGTFLRTEITDRIEADFHIGLPEEHHARVAELVSAGERSWDSDPESIPARVAASPLPAAPGAYTSPEYLMAEIPSANGHGNARSIARVGTIMAMGGELEGTRFLSRGTIDEALEEQIYVTDLVERVPIRWGLGAALPSAEFPFRSPNVLHWGGYGGSICIMNVDRKRCFAFAMNRLTPDFAGDPRALNILTAKRR